MSAFGADEWPLWVERGDQRPLSGTDIDRPVVADCSRTRPEHSGQVADIRSGSPHRLARTTAKGTMQAFHEARGDDRSQTPKRSSLQRRLSRQSPFVGHEREAVVRRAIRSPGVHSERVEPAMGPYGPQSGLRRPIDVLAERCMTAGAGPLTRA